MILLALPVSLVRAQESGKSFRWYPLKARFPEGECVEVGKDPSGNEFNERVKSDSCRPEKTTFLWLKGVCWEVDEATQGQGFGRKLDPKDCTPKDPQATAFSFDSKKRECWLVDKATQGVAFKRQATLDECRPVESELKKVFVATPRAQVGGDCYEVHRELGETRWARKLDPAECRTQKTRYAWLSQGDLKGACWEVDEDGPQNWSMPTRALNCQPEKVQYRFQRTSEKSGLCWEVDRATNGLQWAIQTDTFHCRPE